MPSAAGVATLQLTGACRWMPTAETWPLITFLAAWAFGHAGLVYMTGGLEGVLPACVCGHWVMDTGCRCQAKVFSTSKG